MRIMDIQQVLTAENAYIRRRYKAEVKGIFGSYARGGFPRGQRSRFVGRF